MGEKIIRNDDLDTSRKIGECVKQLRKERKIKQQDFADMLGYSKSHMCALENGRKNFTIDSLVTLSRYLDVNVEALMAGVSGSYVRRVEEDAYKILMDDVTADSSEVIRSVIRMAWLKDHPNGDFEGKLKEIEKELKNIEVKKP